MTRKDFIDLADRLRPVIINGGGWFSSVEAIIGFLHTQNPRFDECKWRQYLFGGKSEKY